MEEKAVENAIEEAADEVATGSVAKSEVEIETDTREADEVAHAVNGGETYFLPSVLYEMRRFLSADPRTNCVHNAMTDYLSDEAVGEVAVEAPMK
ncbi:517_t:CDS:2 [Paraglomus occultum]|uniref:517_t:CDS:1 n=1 Tax=Paraglomus occultum TaxID=144539 RepID=A0A9N9GDM6_9GLOM|nr:517_t:CDS:2 [Paraglomus occultum]